MRKWFRFRVRSKKKGDVIQKKRELVSDKSSLGAVKYEMNLGRKMGEIKMIQTADFAVSGGIAKANAIKALVDMKAKGIETVLLKAVPQNSKTSKEGLDKFYSSLGFVKAYGDYYAIENLQTAKLPNIKRVKKP